MSDRLDLNWNRPRRQFRKLSKSFSYGSIWVNSHTVFRFLDSRLAESLPGCFGAVFFLCFVEVRKRMSVHGIKSFKPPRHQYPHPYAIIGASVSDKLCDRCVTRFRFVSSSAGSPPRLVTTGSRLLCICWGPAIGQCMWDMYVKPSCL